MKLKPNHPRCPCCKRPFIPDPRNRYHQKFCSKALCQKVSKAASQQQWGARSGYWRGEVNKKHVRDWREEHPQYWKRGKRR
ncbi:MAG: hypothetical protein ABMA26_00635 [Limisphaerales bacterium]